MWRAESDVFTVHSVCAAECGTECVRVARSQCPRQCVFFGQGRWSACSLRAR